MNWISVKKELPRQGIRVLVCLFGDVFNNQIEVAELNIKEYWYFGDEWNNKFVSQFVTHWMPLPELPK